jgi:predicted phosphoribosyltransferase
VRERFRDRRHAGRLLGQDLQVFRTPDVIVVGLPRGGVPVAKEVAGALGAPLDVFIVRKVGVPGHEELAMGAIASGGVRVLNQDVVSSLRIDPHVLERSIEAEAVELERRENLYRGDRPPLDLRGKVVIIVDDGLATGSTMRAAIQAVRGHSPTQIVVGIPVAAPSVCESLRSLADDVVCVATPKDLHAVGQWYEDFSQTSDEEVADLLGMDHA